MAACTRKDRKKYRILLSSFTAEEKVKLSTLIQKLGGTYVDTPVSFWHSSFATVVHGRSFARVCPLKGCPPICI